MASTSSSARSTPLSRSVRTFLWLALLVFVAILADLPRIASYLSDAEAFGRGMRELTTALDSGRSYGLPRTELLVLFELTALPVSLIGGVIGIALTLRRSPHTARFWRAYLAFEGIVAIMQLLFLAASVTIVESLEQPALLYAGAQLALLVFCAVWIGFWNDPLRYGETFGGPVDEGRERVPLPSDPLVILPLTAVLGAALWIVYRSPTTAGLVKLGESVLALFTFS